MPVYFPPLPGTANDADTVIAGQVFAPRKDVFELRNAGLKSVLGFTTTALGVGSDADTIIAGQVFGP